MGGTLEGGRKAAESNKKRYGKDFYARIGSKGGKVSKGGGFKDRDFAVKMGQKGGKTPRKGTVRYARKQQED